MNESQNIEQTQTEPIKPDSQVNRTQALVDILYLTNVSWLYVFSLIYPLFGIIFGIVILTGSISSPAKRIGKICLILGIINIGLFVLSLILILLFSRYFTDLAGWTL